MVFEGPEKKLEINFDKGTNLLAVDRSQWDSVIEAAGAKILSELFDGKCRAYLLSESSLFIYSDRVILITCGTTTLVGAAEKMIEIFDRSAIVGIFYQRKNENFPHYQKTCFVEDVKILERYFNGRSFQFGKEDEHHMFLFHWFSSDYYSTNEVSGVQDNCDFTLEVLMNGLPKNSPHNFFDGKVNGEIIEKSGLRDILPGFEFDEFIFDPLGYSINALDGGQYFTIHVTPQQRGSYVSFETNAVQRDQAAECVSKVVGIFRPSTFDVICFDSADQTLVKPLVLNPSYSLRRHVSHRLDSGYQVGFYHFFEPLTSVESAYEITGSLK